MARHRIMKRDAATKGRSRSQLSLGEATSHQLKRPSSAQRRPSSKFVFNIEGLPDEVLVEILSRLPCNKFVFQCKRVSKRWCTLISDPYFIARFLYLQSYKKIPIKGTLLNSLGEEFLNRMSPSQLLTPVLKRIMSFHCLKEEPIMVRTHNDLVLCCATRKFQRDYYICNPYTMQWVALPPTPTRCHKLVRVGFICDVPYYNYKKDNQKGHFIQLNAEYRCRVVRILIPPCKKGQVYDFSELNVEIFSSETGEWRESVASTPRSFRFYDYLQGADVSFAYNGMLYWKGFSFVLFGLDPFNNSNSSNGDDIIDPKLRFTVFEMPLDHPHVHCLGVCGGCVRMCHFCFDSKTLFVWELKEEDHDHMVDGAPAGKLCLSEHKVYCLDPKMYPDHVIKREEMLGFDPIKKDILYLVVGVDIFICNICTGKWSKMVRESRMRCRSGFPFVLPWWPTPVPKLPQRAYDDQALICDPALCSNPNPLLTLIAAAEKVLSPSLTPLAIPATLASIPN